MQYNELYMVRDQQTGNCTFHLSTVLSSSSSLLLVCDSLSFVGVVLLKFNGELFVSSTSAAASAFCQKDNRKIIMFVNTIN